MDLDILYDDFDVSYEMDFYKLSNLIIDLKDKKNKFLINKKVKPYFTFLENIIYLYQKLYAFAILKSYKDITNINAEIYLDKLLKVKGQIDDYIIDLSFDANLFEYKYPFLEKIRKMYNNIDQQRLIRYDKINIASKNRLGILNQLIEFEGDSLPVSSFLYKVYDTKDLKIMAYLKQIAFCKDIEEYMNCQFNIVHKENINNCKVLNKSTLEYSLEYLKIDHDMLEIMVSNLNNVLPEFQKYIDHKAKKLGYQCGLPYFEFLDNKSISLSFDTAKNIILDAFYKYDKKLGAFAKDAFDNEWFDVYPRQNKRDGALTINIEPINESRILLNYVGSLKDIIIIAHELGHAYFNFLTTSRSPFLWETPVIISESAAYLCETIVLEKLYSDNKVECMSLKLENSIELILDLYSRFLFEKEIDGKVDLNDITTIMLEKQKYVYRNLDSANTFPYLWITKSHFYNGNIFYNYPYIFGILIGRYLYKKKNSFAFFKGLNNSSVYEFGLKIGLDLKTDLFYQDMFGEMIDDINKLRR